MELKFKVGKKFDETTPDGRKISDMKPRANQSSPRYNRSMELKFKVREKFDKTTLDGSKLTKSKIRTINGTDIQGWSHM